MALGSQKQSSFSDANMITIAMLGREAWQELEKVKEGLEVAMQVLPLEGAYEILVATHGKSHPNS